MDNCRCGKTRRNGFVPDAVRRRSVVVVVVDNDAVPRGGNAARRSFVLRSYPGAPPPLLVPLAHDAAGTVLAVVLTLLRPLKPLNCAPIGNSNFVFFGSMTYFRKRVLRHVAAYTGSLVSLRAFLARGFLPALFSLPSAPSTVKLSR